MATKTIGLAAVAATIASVAAIYVPMPEIEYPAPGRSGGNPGFTVKLDKYRTAAESQNEDDLQVLSYQALAGRSKFRAERTGFEPANQVSPVTDLANRRIRPLCHLSRGGGTARPIPRSFDQF
jgi:hypothetical protein